MFRVVVTYWFEDIDGTRHYTTISESVKHEYEINSVLHQYRDGGFYFMTSHGFRRAVLPHQIVDTIVYVMDESGKEYNAEKGKSPRPRGNARMSKPIPPEGQAEDTSDQ